MRRPGSLQNMFPYLRFRRMTLYSTVLAGGVFLSTSSPGLAACDNDGPAAFTCGAGPSTEPVNIIESDIDNFTVNLDGTTFGESDLSGNDAPSVVFAIGLDNTDINLLNRSAVGVGINANTLDGVMLFSEQGDVVVGGAGTQANPFSFGPAQIRSDFLIEEITTDGARSAFILFSGTTDEGGAPIAGEGSISAAIKGGSIVTGAADGVNANVFNGNAILLLDTDITSEGTAIRATAYGSGNLGIDISTDSSIAGEHAIVAVTNSGSIAITNAGKLETEGSGILAEITDTNSAGTITIDHSGVIDSNFSGIFAEGWKGSVKVVNSGSIAAKEEGIHADAVASGTNRIEITSTGSVSADDWIGIHASNSGTGSVIIEAADLNARSADGIVAEGRPGAGNQIKVTSNGIVSAGDRGLVAENTAIENFGPAGEGAVIAEVTSTSTVTAGGDGIYLRSDTGQFEVHVKGNVKGGTSGEGFGLGVVAGDKVNGTINNAAILEGADGAFAFITDGASDVTINNIDTGVLRNSSESAESLAIVTNSESATNMTLVNAGTIIGRIMTDSGTDRIINSGNWQSSGLSEFGEGDDVLENFGAVQILAGTSNVTRISVPSEVRDILDFGGGNDTFTNNGTLSVKNGSAHFRNLEVFNNVGTIDMSDSAADDALYIDGTFVTGGILSLDVVRASDGSVNTDKLITDVISTTPDGPTRLIVNSVGDLAQVDEDIIIFENGAPEGAFVLGNQIVGGIRSFDLAVGQNGELVLRPGDAVVPPGIILPTINSVGTENPGGSGTGADILERPGAPNVDAGAYAQVVGGVETRELSGSYINKNTGGVTGYSDHYDMDVYGFIFGMDRTDKVTLDDGSKYAIVKGGFAGVVGSSVSFDDSPNKQDMLGGVAGAYVAYAQGPWRLRVTGKIDIGMADVSTGTDSDKSQYIVPGFSVSTGYRINVKDKTYVQPIASMVFSHAITDTMTLDGNSIDYENTTSLRGRLGLRIASYIDGENHILEPWAQASIWNEFAGETKATFTGTSGAFDFGGPGGGAYGEISIGANLINKSNQGWSGNIRGDFSFGENDLFGAAGKLGVEYRFPVN